MDEASKSKRHWNSAATKWLVGSGIDIGCGSDPITPDVRCFDVNDGDANVISQYVHEHFDFVFSSHCLEHMNDPFSALQEWWKLVKPGGVLFFLVPDEDLYEQGVFPSRFNPDHKATFTISKRRSWSPKSVNVLELCQSLPMGDITSLELQDEAYDRQRLVYGALPSLTFRDRLARKIGRFIGGPATNLLYMRDSPVDQTLGLALAQIQAVIIKRRV